MAVVTVKYRSAILVHSISRTEDEYLGILVLTLEEYDKKNILGNGYVTLPDLICVITEKAQHKTD